MKITDIFKVYLFDCTVVVFFCLGSRPRSSSSRPITWSVSAAITKPMRPGAAVGTEAWRPRQSPVTPGTWEQRQQRRRQAGSGALPRAAPVGLLEGVPTARAAGAGGQGQQSQGQGRRGVAICSAPGGRNTG